MIEKRQLYRFDLYGLRTLLQNCVFVGSNIENKLTKICSGLCKISGKDILHCGCSKTTRVFWNNENYQDMKHVSRLI